MPPAETTSVHEPLSQTVARILAGDAARGSLTANQLIARTGGRGFYLVFVLLGGLIVKHFATWLRLLLGLLERAP